MTRRISSRRMVWRGELAAALLSGDAATVEFVAQNLGLDTVEQKEPQPKKPISISIPDPVLNEETTIAYDYPVSSEASRFWLPFHYQSRAKLEFPPPPACRWEWRNPPLEPPKHIPIATKSVVHPRLRAAVSSLATGRALDLPKVIRKLARLEPLEQIPGKRLRRWGRQILIIRDQSDRLVPFFHDQEQLCRQLAALTPEGAITQLYCRDPSEEFVFVDATGNFASWKPDVPARIVVLSDLGFLQRGGDGRLQQRWIEWGRGLANRGFSVVGLVPFPVRAAGSDLRRTFTLVPWQRAERHYVQAEVRRSHWVNELLTAASPVVRLEPGLLRSLRLAIPEALDASLESDVWQHPVVIGRHVDAAILDRRALEQRYCPRFAQLPYEQRERFLTTIRSWRFEFCDSPEVWFQELLNLDAESQQIVEALFPGDLEDAIAGIHELATRARHVDHRRSLRLREYGGRVAGWLSEHAWNDLRIRQAIHDLWDASPFQGVPPNPSVDPALLSPKGEQVRFTLAQRGSDLEFAFHHQSGVSPITSIVTASRLITVTSVDAEKPFWKSGRPPAWARDWGRDEFGAWVEFEIEPSAREAGTVPVVQRMRWIPPGQFLMGSPETEAGRFDDEGPRRTVTLTRGFWLFDTPVTQELWRAVMGNNPSRFRGDRRPVEKVSWDDTQRFLGALNTRFGESMFVLPTEAQWECACRAGTTTAYSFGDDPAVLEEYAWYGSNSDDVTHEVATKQCNGWGLFDMHGNVWEWCQDIWRVDYNIGSVVGPTGPSEGHNRVLRGGCWNYNRRKSRTASRTSSLPGYRNGLIGFRCAQVPGAAEPTEEDRGAAEPRARPTKGGAAAALKIDLGQSARTPLPPRAAVIVVQSDIDSLELRQISKPEWASAIGRDRFGLWAEFTVNAPDSAVEAGSGKKRKRKDKPRVVAASGAIVQRMRWIPPGRFLMGSPAGDDLASSVEKPQHEVTLSCGYWLFDTPVTQELWLAVMKKNPSHFSGARLPVEQVSWEDCQTFLAEINRIVPGVKLSLPTEAEWEYACRAGTTTRYSFGDEVLPDQASYGHGAPSEWKTSVVGAFPPNAWGLFDMHGNVWEWCQDFWGRDYKSGAVVDPIGPPKGRYRVLRGGSWNRTARYARSAFRFYYHPGSRIINVGFRCAQVQAEKGTREQMS